MPFKFNRETNKLEELPRMVHPDNKYFDSSDDRNEYISVYNAHLSTLKQYEAGTTEWPEGVIADDGFYLEYKDSGSVAFPVQAKGDKRKASDGKGSSLMTPERLLNAALLVHASGFDVDLMKETHPRTLAAIYDAMATWSESENARLTGEVERLKEDIDSRQIIMDTLGDAIAELEREKEKLRGKLKNIADLLWDTPNASARDEAFLIAQEEVNKTRVIRK